MQKVILDCALMFIHIWSGLIERIDALNKAWANAYLQIFKWKPTVLSLMVLRNTIRDKVFRKKPQYFSKIQVNSGSKT